MTHLAATLPIAACHVEVDQRVRAVVAEHYDALWRFVRRMGVPDGHVEDAVQQVLMVFARRGRNVEPRAERSFLFRTALRVAADVRRSVLRRREVANEAAIARVLEPAADPESALDDKQMRQCLDKILDGLSPELRAVFVLVEIEEMTMAETGRLLSIPPGTVASRLRRARVLVETSAAEIRLDMRSER